MMPRQRVRLDKDWNNGVPISWVSSIMSVYDEAPSALKKADLVLCVVIQYRRGAINGQCRLMEINGDK